MTLKLLIVDDSELIVPRLRGLLESIKGISAIHTAQTLAQAQAIMQRVIPTLVILDLHLPDGNAIPLIRFLKQQTPVMQIGILTNDANEFNRNKCLHAGANWFFDKSTELEKMLEVVQKQAALN